MTIDDGVTFVGALGGLVDALGKAGQGAFGGSKPCIEGGDVLLFEIAAPGHLLQGGGIGAGAVQGGCKAFAVSFYVVAIGFALFVQIAQQAVEQSNVAARNQR